MARPMFKKKCNKCWKNYVLTNNRNDYLICYDCQKDQLEGEIVDPKMKELFDIPEDLYKQSMFLRDIKIKYLKWGNLTEKQIESFQKTVEKIINEE